MRRSRKRDADRLAWLEKSKQWDGVAVAFNRNLGRYISMDDYKGTGAERAMAKVDAMPPEFRSIVYDFNDHITIFNAWKAGASAALIRKSYG